MININFKLVHEDAVIPYKAHEGDLGLDIYPAFDFDYKEIEPGDTKLIPTGIKSSIPEEYSIVFKERSGLGSDGIKVSAGVIDSSYRGQWYVALYNTLDIPVVIAKYPSDFDEENIYIIDYSNAIAQGIIIENHMVNSNIVKDLDDTSRNENGFASTDE